MKALTSVMTLCFGILLALTNSHAQQNSVFNQGEVLLPQQVSIDYSTASNPDPSYARIIDNFEKVHGDWTFQINNYTGTPHRAFGKAIKINGYDEITEANVRDAAMTFIRDNADLLKVDPDNLKLRSAREARGKWYVSYYQVYEGIKVLFSEVELRIYKNGNVMAFGSDYYNNINLKTTPEVSWSSAKATAAEGLSAKTPEVNETLSGKKLYIIPLKKSGSIDYKLVWKYNVKTSDNFEDYISYVDAQMNQVVWRFNQYRNLDDLDYSSNGTVRMTSSFDSLVNVNMPYQNIYIGDDTITTDKNGEFTYETDEPLEMNAQFNGPFAKVSIVDGVSADYSSTFTPGENNSIDWNDDNSHLFERQLFYHANKIYQFAKFIDPGMTAMDFPIDIQIEMEGQQPNAGSSGEMIRFMAAANENYKFVETPTVLYHEYTHSINFLLYEDLGVEDGMVNLLCHEGTADFMASLIINEPKMGIGAFPNEPERYMRNLENNIVFPDSMTGESHFDGQCLSGAFWEIKEQTSIPYVAALSHFAKYGTPDDPEDAVALSEWFLETLIADDDDGDLSNGTPHYQIIVEAFNRHGIGINLYLKTSFVHEAYPDTRITDQPYNIEFELNSFEAFQNNLDSVSVVYSTDNFNTVNTVPAEYDGEGNFTARIPAQEKGTVVQYYIRVYDKITGNDIRITDGFAYHPYDFLVGYYLAKEDDFEGETDWTVNSAGVQQGKGWELGKPQRMDLSMIGFGVIQPGDDHSPDGDKCFVTGAEGTAMQFYQSMILGRSELISRDYDLNEIQKPVLRYWIWFKHLKYGKGDFDPKLIIDVSTDAGQTWMNIDTMRSSSDDWQKKMIPIAQYVEGAETFRVRFVADNPFDMMSGGEGMPICEALIDDVEIFSTNQITSVDEDENPVNAVKVYPNPFDEDSRIKFTAASSGTAVVSIYDIFGNEIEKLFSGNIPAGDNTFRWNGNNAAAGLYLVKVNMNGKVHTAKIIKQ